MKEIVVKARWPDARPWSLDDPYLYRLTTTVAEGGTALDRLDTRFGFRELWTDGPRFVMNGVSMKLFATSGVGCSTRGCRDGPGASHPNPGGKARRTTAPY